MSHTHAYLYPCWVRVTKKMSKRSEVELDLKDEESSTSREEKTFLVDEAVITKISRLKKSNKFVKEL